MSSEEGGEGGETIFLHSSWGFLCLRSKRFRVVVLMAFQSVGS